MSTRLVGHRDAKVRTPMGWRRAALIAVSLLAAALTWSVPSAGAGPNNSFDNASVANAALTKLGQNFGQCWTFMNAMVRTATGGRINVTGDYYWGYANNGGVLQSQVTASRGDIIQIYNPANTSGVSGYYTGMHTAIVVDNLGGGNFNVVDSNSRWDGVVRSHSYNPYSAAAANRLTVAIWRLGSGARGPVDVIARRVDGNLYLYPGDGRGGWKSGGVQIGSGWLQFDQIIGAGDFNGDGTADVIARRVDGNLYLYPGDGRGGWKSGGVQIGSGWLQFDQIIGSGGFD